jgi:outer membrane protein OmpA-like peptidoglycan-associated protein
MALSSSPDNPKDSTGDSRPHSTDDDTPEITPEIARDLALLRKLLLNQSDEPEHLEPPTQKPHPQTISIEATPLPTPNENRDQKQGEELNDLDKLQQPLVQELERLLVERQSELSADILPQSSVQEPEPPLPEDENLTHVENSPQSSVQEPESPLPEDENLTHVENLPQSSVQEPESPLPEDENLTHVENLPQSQTTAIARQEVYPVSLSPSQPEDTTLQQLQMLLFGSHMTSLQGKVHQIEHQLFDPDALVKLLTPIIVDLLDRQVRDSKEEMTRALFPIVDRLIFQRAREDKKAMSAALAAVIPEAITQQIRNDPDTVVQAISPMMGAAIADQLHNDRDTIIEALAPAMGRAIKQQIELERDIMVDALYPIVGRTVSRYLGEAIQEINNKVANALSIQGIKRKVISVTQGVSEAELILKEALPCRVQTVFLIHKASGLTIADAQQENSLHLEPDMVAGMLTAIRSFVNDCIAQSGNVSELDEIEYGDSKILLEVAGYCYLAVAVKGDPPRSFIEKMRDTLSELIQKYGDEIENYDGDPDSIPEEVNIRVQHLLEVLLIQAEKSQGFPWWFAGLAAAAIALLLIPLGIYQYRQSSDRRLEATIEQRWYNTPELSVYNLDADVRGDRLILNGRVPTVFLRDRAANLAQPLAGERALENQIQAAIVPADPVETAAEVQRTLDLLNQKEGINIAAEYQAQVDAQQRLQPGTTIVTGTINRLDDAIAVTQAFGRIPGVGTVTNTVQVAIPGLNTRFYFRTNSTRLETVDIKGKIPLIERQLKQYPDIHLKIVGYSPPSEPGSSMTLAQQRAIAVQTALIERGIAPQRLAVSGQTTAPSDVTATAPDWMGRCVRLEVELPPFKPHSP